MRITVAYGVHVTLADVTEELRILRISAHIETNPPNEESASDL